MIPDSLTAQFWLKILDRIVRHTDDETLRTLAAMLADILRECHDPHIAEIIDTYANRLLQEDLA